METEVVHPLFRSSSPHHLAEVRIEPAHSAVAFSAPCAAEGLKRRCVLPAFPQRKKMLLEMHPFDSAPSPSPPPSPRNSPATAPPLLSRVAFPASDFSFPPALAWTGGSGGNSGGGNIFAFTATAPSTPSPTGSNVSALSFLALPGQPTTPTGSTASGGFAFSGSPEQRTTPKGSTASGCFAFLASPKQPTTPTGPTASGGFMFTASPEQPLTPLTPTGSTASGGLVSLPSPKPPLSPRECDSSRVVASLPSLKPARAGSTDSGGLAFFPSPGPAIGNTGSPAPLAFIFSALPVRKSGGGSNKRSRRHLGVVTARRPILRQREEPQKVTQPPQKVAKTRALATCEASRSSILSGPCCTFFTSPAKAGKQEEQQAKKASSEASRSSSARGSRCTFVTSPARRSSVEKASKREREVEVSSATREGPTSSAACPGAEVVVRVTCTCGVQKEFCFDHCH